MRALLPIILGASLFLPLSASAQPDISALAERERQLARDPYAYDVRQSLVAEALDAGQYAVAYYHAAWLAWLAPQRCADSDTGLALLRDRDARTRADRERLGALTPIVAAAEATQLLANTCRNGAIAQQASRLRSDILDLLARAEAAEAEAGQTDPLGRIALAHLCLSLDDALTFEDTADSRRSRLTVLRQAASRAAAAATWLPDSPGVHHTLAVIRARLADLEGRSDFWDLAIAEAERAHQLDPDDATLVEFLWVLHLRAGNWAEAKRWQDRLGEAGE